MKFSGLLVLVASYAFVNAQDIASPEDDLGEVTVASSSDNLDSLSAASKDDFGDFDDFESKNLTRSTRSPKDVNDLSIAAYGNSSQTETENNVEPIHYSIRFIPDIKSKSFTTKMNLDFKIRRGSNQLTFHAMGLNMTKTLLNVGSSSNSSVKTNTSSTDFDLQNGQEPKEIIQNESNITLVFDSELEADKEFQLNFEVEGKIPEEALSGEGLIYSDSSMKKEGSYMLYANFEQEGARRVFPCIDEPTTRALFTWEVEHDDGEDIIAISNTDVESTEESTTKGKKITKFAETPLFATYHNTFAILKGSEKVTVTEFGRTKVEAYFNLRTEENEDDEKYYKPSIEAAARSMEYFEKKLGIEYPLETLRILFVPELPEGILGSENFGMMTVLSSSTVVSTSEKCEGSCTQYVIMLHEAAHQWLGGIVTIQTWDQGWIKEGLTQWMTFAGLKDLYPENFRQSPSYGDPAYARMIDTLRDVPPLALQKSHNLDPAFATIWRESVYMKSVYIFSAFSQIIGEKNFYESLSRLINNRSYKAAGYQDVVEAFKDVSQITKKFLDAWVGNAGHPTVNLFKFTKNESTIILKQKADITLPPAKKGYKRDYPTYIELILGNKGKQKRLVLKDARRRYKISSKNIPYIMFNNSANNAFYEPYYSTRHIKSLGIQGAKKVMTPEHRIYLLNQLGYSHDILARLVNYWAKEDDAKVFKTMMLRIRSMTVQFSQYIPDLAPALEKFLANMMRHRIQTIGVLNSTSEASFDKLSASDVEMLNYGCLTNHSDTFELCSKLYQEYTKDSNDEKAKKLRSALLTHATAFAKEEVRQDAIQSLKKKVVDPSADRRERYDIAKALGVIGDEKELKEILDSMMASQEALGEEGYYFPTFDIFVRLMSRGLNSTNVLWEWTKDNWDKIKDNDALVYSTTGEPTRAFISLRQAEDYCNFFKEHKDEISADTVGEINTSLVKFYYRYSKMQKSRAPLLRYLSTKGYVKRGEIKNIKPAISYPRDGPLLQKLCYV